MSRRSSSFSLSLMIALALVACSKKDKEPASAPSGSAGSAAAGSGSDTGSAMAGSGSDSGPAMAGSGSDAGSAADGSGSDAGSAAAGSGDSGDATAVEFDDLSQEDKVKFMKTKVMPPMKAAFQKFDPKEFANFTCKTCHGKDPKKSKYEMPSPELPKLDFEAIKKGDEKEWVEFMTKVVKPEMAKILGEKEMTETEPKGFGCLHCHEQKK